MNIFSRKQFMSLPLAAFLVFGSIFVLTFLFTKASYAADAQVTILSPQNSSTVSGNTVTLNYSKNGDFSLVNHVHLQLDGNPEVEDTSMQGSYTFYNVISGPHTLRVSLANADHSVISGSLVQISFNVVNGDQPGTSDVKAPVITPNGGSITASTSIVMSSNYPDGVIYYSTNTIVGAVYKAPITLAQGTKLIAFVRRPGHADSPVTIVDFTIIGSSVPPSTTPPVVTPPPTPPATPPVTPPDNTQSPVTNSTIYESGTLVNDRSTIYVILRREKIPFTDMKAFTGLGYSTSYVINGDVSGYPLPPNGYNLHSDRQDHAWGTWLDYSGTIYYSDPTGLIGVPSWDVFLANGGKSQYIIKANAADLAILAARTNLPLLTANDSRVIR